MYNLFVSFFLAVFTFQSGVASPMWFCVLLLLAPGEICWFSHRVTCSLILVHVAPLKVSRLETKF